MGKKGIPIKLTLDEPEIQQSTLEAKRNVELLVRRVPDEND